MGCYYYWWLHTGRHLRSADIRKLVVRRTPMVLGTRDLKWRISCQVPAFSALAVLVGRQEGHPACTNWVVGYWRGYLTGARTCRLAQRMPLRLTVSCFSKIQIGLSFLVPAHLVSPGKSAVKRVCVCVCVFVCVSEFGALGLRRRRVCTGRCWQYVSDYSSEYSLVPLSSSILGVAAWRALPWNVSLLFSLHTLLMIPYEMLF